MSLKPEVLDIIVRKITAHHIYYDLTLTGVPKEWEIPSNSTFDKTQVRVGVRYKVISNVIMTKVRKTKKAGKRFYRTVGYEMIERYDWAAVTPLASYIPCQSRTAKESRAVHEAGRLELVDNGDLFVWNPVK
jgi:hypothetical protein